MAERTFPEGFRCDITLAILFLPLIADKDITVRPHSGLLCVAEGSIRYGFDGGSFEAAVGDAVYLPPDCPPYSYHISPDPATGNAQLMQIEFDLTCGGRTVSFSDVPRRFPAGEGEHRELFRAVILSRVRTDEAARKNAADALAGLLCRLFGETALNRAADGTAVGGQAADSPAAKRIEPVLRFLGENVGKPVRERELAALCHLSEPQLRRLFRAVTGQTILAFRDERRLAAACRMLSEEDRAVGDLASELGFCDIYAFSHWFRKKTGKSPVEYRKGNVS